MGAGSNAYAVLLAALVAAPYVTIALDGTLTNERKLTMGANMSMLDGGANGDVTLSSSGGGPGGSSAIQQAEIDFGAVPVSEGFFLIADAAVTPNMNILASIAYEAPTGKELDEVEMDDLQVRCGAGTGLVSVYVKAADGSYLEGKFLLNYMAAEPA